MLPWLLLLLALPAFAGSEAESLLLRGRVEEALPVARKEAEAAPADLAAQERYIDLLLTLGMPDVAITTYKDRVQVRDDADSWYLLGRAVLAAEDAKTAYDAALARDPKHARAQMGLGAVYRSQGRFDDAIAAYEKALERDPKLGEAWAGLGAAQMAKGDFQAALAAARQGMANVPDQADSYLAVSVLAPDEARAVLDEAAKACPEDPRVYAALSEELLQAGEGSAAKEAAEKALVLDATRSDARLSLMFAESMASGALDAAGYQGLLEARALEDLDVTEARANYDQLVGAYPRSPLTWMGRARVRAGAGDPEGALADLSEAMKVDPANVEAMAASGLLLLEAGRASEAKPLLKRVVAERPYDASLALAYAGAQRQTGDPDGALATLGAAEAQHPYDARLVLTHAKWLAEAGRSQEAYTLLKGGVQRMPGDDRLVLSLAAAAKDLGKLEEAADLIDVLAERSGNADLRELARKLRAGEL